MTVKILDGEYELTAISFVNGVLIGVDENVEDYDIEDENKNQKNDIPKRRLKKDPEDNLGSAVAVLDTDKIERGVDFVAMKRNIDYILENNGWTLSDFFKNDNIIADFCEHYEYTLPNFVRLMMEHMPDVVDLGFLRSVVRPTITALQKLKNEYENGTTESQTENGTVEYRRIFAYL